MATAAPENMSARRPFRALLRNRAFRKFWLGETTSEFGNRMAVVAMPLLAVAVLRAGTFTVGILTALQYAPWLLVSLPAGAWLDRVRRCGVMIACDVIAALLFASIPIAAWTGTLTIEQVMAVSLLTGTAAVFFKISYRAYLPDLLAAGDVARGNATLQASANTAALAGPGIGGYAVQALGAASSLLFNASTFGISAICLWSTRGQEARNPARQRTKAGRSLRGDIGAGARFVFRDPYLRPIVLWAAVANFGLTGYDALFMLFLVRVVHVEAVLIGLLMAASGVGAIAGSLAAVSIGNRLGTARGFFLAAFCAEPFALLIPLTGPGWRLMFFAAGGVIFASGIAVCNVFTASLLQAYPPRDMRARTTATSRFVLNGAYLPGALLGGVLGTWLGIRDGIWVALGVSLLGNIFLVTRPLLRHRDLPDRPPILASPPAQ